MFRFADNVKKYILIAIVTFGFLSIQAHAEGTLLDTLIGTGKKCNYVNKGLYMPFSDVDTSFPVFGKLVADGCVNVTNQVSDMFATGFKVFLGIVSLLAVVNIARAGIEYIFTEQSPGSKSKAKQRLTQSIVALILAFSGWLILNTVNSKLTDVGFNLTTGALADLVQKGASSITNIAEVDGVCINGVACGAAGVTQGDGKGTPVSGIAAENNVNYGSVQGMLTTAQNAARRATNGDLNISLYSHEGDDTTDSNTSAQRGNNNNLLVQGSVALSPDLVDKLKPKAGQEIYVGNTLVGYFDDTTGRVAGNGTPIVNTVDIYNPTGSLGSTNNTLKVIPGGQVSLGTRTRPQTKNP